MVRTDRRLSIRSESRRGELADALHQQADWCERLGSPLYARLLRTSEDDLRAGGPVAAVIGEWEGDPLRAALALRFMGAVHALALDGRAPELARHYPSCGGTPGPGLAADFLAAVERHNDAIRRGCEQEVQTNEVNRSGALLGGLLTLPWTENPFRLLEIGASAGLNLLLDRYRYELAVGSWGAEDSPVTIASDWSGAIPQLRRSISVAARAGCDIAPIDPADADARLRLQSFVWPDQTARFYRLRGALKMAVDSPPPVVAAPAEKWLAGQLSDGPSPTVVMHSIMWQYLGDAAQQAAADAIHTAGARATAEAPLARVAMEPHEEGFAVHVDEWPGGERRLVATCQPHGAWVRFVDGSPRAGGSD